MIHVLTRFSRHENYEQMKAILNFDSVQWHLILDGPPPLPLADWIDAATFHRNPESDPHCYGLTNRWIETRRIEDNDWFHFLNDDDAVEPGFYDKLQRLDVPERVVVCRMLRGNRIPHGVVPLRAYPTTPLEPRPENMRVGEVGDEQFILRGDILRQLRFQPEHHAADGMAAQWLVRNFPIHYAPELNVLFNYLEPGRWNQ